MAYSGDSTDNSDIDIFGPAETPSAGLNPHVLIQDAPLPPPPAQALIPEKNGGLLANKAIKPGVALKTLADGTQAPVNVATTLTNDQICATLSNAVTKPYEGKDPRHMGKNKLEAGMDALVDKFAQGDKEAAVIIMDRLGGKPAQITKQLTVNTDLSTFLESLK